MIYMNQGITIFAKFEGLDKYGLKKIALLS